MTDHDKSAFDTAFNQLSKAGLIHDRDVVTKGVYFDTLSDLPLWAVEMAATRLRREPVKFFTSAIWHEKAAKIWQDQRKQDATLLASKKLTASIYCDRCNDTGMRPSDADPDRYTHCECRESNPNYQVERARRRLADEEVQTPQIPDSESRRITGAVRDFKRISSGGD